MVTAWVISCANSRKTLSLFNIRSKAHLCKVVLVGLIFIPKRLKSLELGIHSVCLWYCGNCLVIGNFLMFTMLLNKVSLWVKFKGVYFRINSSRIILRRSIFHQGLGS